MRQTRTLDNRINFNGIKFDRDRITERNRVDRRAWCGENSTELVGRPELGARLPQTRAVECARGCFRTVLEPPSSYMTRRDAQWLSARNMIIDTRARFEPRPSALRGSDASSRPIERFWARGVFESVACFAVPRIHNTLRGFRTRRPRAGLMYGARAPRSTDGL